MDNPHINWIMAIESSMFKINYKLLDISSFHIEDIEQRNYDMILFSPFFPITKTKILCDEVAHIINNVLKILIYPNFNSLYIYENKRLLSYTLQANNISCPKTHIYYNKIDALNYSKNVKYPSVAKTVIGASGLGVKIIQTENEMIAYINKAFGKGLSVKSGPDFRKPNLFSRFKKIILDYEYLVKKISSYKRLSQDKQNGFVLFQDYISHQYEWRCVRIGNSYFAHKKIAKNNVASGYLIKEYCNPPIELLNFVKETSDLLGIDSAAFDLFEINGEFLVNEIQAFFGQSDSFQMLVDGIPGRYVYTGGGFLFESGDFNTFKSYSLRLNHAIEIINNSRR